MRAASLSADLRYPSQSPDDRAQQPFDERGEPQLNFAHHTTDGSFGPSLAYWSFRITHSFWGSSATPTQSSPTPRARRVGIAPPLPGVGTTSRDRTGFDRARGSVEAGRLGEHRRSQGQSPRRRDTGPLVGSTFSLAGSVRPREPEGNSRAPLSDPEPLVRRTDRAVRPLASGRALSTRIVTSDSENDVGARKARGAKVRLGNGTTHARLLRSRPNHKLLGFGSAPLGAHAFR